VVVGAVAVALALALDAVWVGTSLLRQARAIRRDLGAGAALLEEGRVADAATRFALAGNWAESMQGALRHPAAVLAGLMPGISEDVEAARALAAASGRVAGSGAALARAAAEVGWDGEGVPGLLGPGQVDTEALARAAPAVEAAARATREARDLLATAPTDGVAGALRAAVLAARAELERRAPALERAAAAAELLPSFLGGEGERRYLLIVQNLSDPRGSGGHVGNHAVLTVDRGRFHLGPFVTTVELPPGPRVEAPADVVARYARFGSLERLMAATYPPEFPTAARLLVAQWEARGEPPVDGVISVDAVAIADLLGAIGPVRTPAWPEPLTPENATEVLGRRTFELTDAEASNALQAELATAIWRALLRRTPPARALGEALSEAAAERHLQVYSTDPQEQALLAELGAAGELPPTEHPLQVTWFGASDSRAGYFAEKEIDYHAVLAPDGWAEVTLTATLRNTAPPGPPSILLGVGSPQWPVGSYQAFVNAYLPPSARVLAISGGFLALEEHERGLPVVMGLIGAEPGGSATFRVRYRVEATTPVPGGQRFALTVLPQPALRPDLVRVLVELPTGAEVLDAAPGLQATAGVLAWEGRPTTPQHLWATIRPAP
jgi:hypothetical protein